MAYPDLFPFGHFGRLRFFNSDFPHLETSLCNLRMRSKPVASDLTVRNPAPFFGVDDETVYDVVGQR
jgi:hypothetical protein